ncbi:MAG: hypothetical protein ISS26_05370 [Candidatus Omnitrophica bacterium]|nr:hypothetical protein [Candidatus Omnitrophota bacterium]
MGNIDYDAFKKRGFLRQKQEGLFVLRTRGQAGNYSAEQLSILVGLSGKFGRGILHATTRQGVEIPFIKFENIDEVEGELQGSGIKTGTSGPRIRTTTCCPGNSRCKSGLIDTFGLFDRIENELNIRCAVDLPHKLKISISGCPNKCTRAEASEIGIHGQAYASDGKRQTGYVVYLGGCGGRTPQLGIKIEKIFTVDEVLSLIERVVKFYKENARPGQRLVLLINETGKEEFLRKMGL